MYKNILSESIKRFSNELHLSRVRPENSENPIFLRKTCVLVFLSRERFPQKIPVFSITVYKLQVLDVLRTTHQHPNIHTYIHVLTYSHIGAYTLGKKGEKKMYLPSQFAPVGMAGRKLFSKSSLKQLCKRWPILQSRRLECSATPSVFSQPLQSNFVAAWCTWSTVWCAWRAVERLRERHQPPPYCYLPWFLAKFPLAEHSPLSLFASSCRRSSLCLADRFAIRPPEKPFSTLWNSVNRRSHRKSVMYRRMFIQAVSSNRGAISKRVVFTWKRKWKWNCFIRRIC